MSDQPDEYFNPCAKCGSHKLEKVRDEWATPDGQFVRVDIVRCKGCGRWRPRRLWNAENPP